MGDIALKNIAAYAIRYNLRIAERLGFGIHGIVHVAEDGSKQQSAIKALNCLEYYQRELGVYERLRGRGISEVQGFHVPQLIRSDDELLVIEMSIVTRPFLLDFAGAFLDERPKFSDEAWAEWETEKREQFGPRWNTIQSALDTLENWGIYLADVSPSNIAFSQEE